MSFSANVRAILTMGRGVVRGVSKLEAGDDPIAMFKRWFEDAKKSGLLLPESMTLATATTDGVPSARMVLLKGVDERGFVFFTNYESRKSVELAQNPAASLVFHWPQLQRQVRIEGAATRISTRESEAYFRTRARGSQLGAWASRQSHELASHEELVRRFRELESRYEGDEVPLPEFWGGFRLEPRAIEFWQGRLNRLHDRLEYRRQGGGWEIVRLYP